MKLKCIVLLFLMYFKSDITFASKHISADYFTTKKLEIKELIERGLFNNAHLKCESLLKQHLSNDQRYEILTTQSKLYFWEENMFAFKMAAQEAVKLKPNQPIYKAYYHAQIAFYYHYSFIGDSAIINSDKAISLLRKHYNERHKIGSHFIYQMFASSCIYRSDYYLNSGNIVNDKRKKIVPIISYLDSALLSIEQYPYFPQEEAIIHRSKGSRLFDLVGYQVRTKASDFKNPVFEKEIFDKVIESYQAAIDCMPATEHNLRKNLDGMLAMAYYTCMQENKADSLTLPYLNKFQANPIGEMGPNFMNSFSLISYYIKNAITKNYPPDKLLQVKSILERILPFWRFYQNKLSINFFDAYDISPHYQLLLIHEYFLKKKPEWADKKMMLNLTLDRFSYYSKNKVNPNLKEENRLFLTKLLAKIELKPTNENQLRFIIKLLNAWQLEDNASHMQAQLEKRDAAILNVGIAPFFLLVQKNNIEVFRLKDYWTFYHLKDYETVKSLKTKGFEIYKFSKILPAIIRRKIKKVYVAPDISLPFDWIVTDLKGSQFNELSYFKKKVNVVKIYNPIDFFIGKKGERKLHTSKKQVWLNKGSLGKLPFSSTFVKHTNKKSQIFNVRNLSQPGILQIIGHGGLNKYGDLDPSSSTLESRELNKVRDPYFKVRKDLVIFNVCYAGSRRGINIFDLGINNLLLSRGAKAVIASPYQTVDQSSAYIFEKFYHYLFKGATVEDALQNAKLNYLQNHTGQLAHPLYWSTYELTSNVKNLRLEPTRKSDYSWMGYLIVIVLTAIVLRFYLFWEEY